MPDTEQSLPNLSPTLSTAAEYARELRADASSIALKVALRDYATQYRKLAHGPLSPQDLVSHYALEPSRITLRNLSNFPVEIIRLRDHLDRLKQAYIEEHGVPSKGFTARFNRDRRSLGKQLDRARKLLAPQIEQCAWLELHRPAIDPHSYAALRRLLAALPALPESSELYTGRDLIDATAEYATKHQRLAAAIDDYGDIIEDYQYHPTAKSLARVTHLPRRVKELRAIVHYISQLYHEQWSVRFNPDTAVKLTLVKRQLKTLSEGCSTLLQLQSWAHRSASNPPELTSTAKFPQLPPLQSSPRNNRCNS